MVVIRCLATHRATATDKRQSPHTIGLADMLDNLAGTKGESASGVDR